MNIKMFLTGLKEMYRWFFRHGWILVTLFALLGVWYVAGVAMIPHDLNLVLQFPHLSWVFAAAAIFLWYMILPAVIYTIKHTS